MNLEILSQFVYLLSRISRKTRLVLGGFMAYNVNTG